MATVQLGLFRSVLGGWRASVVQVADGVLSLVMADVVMSALMLMVDAAALALGVALLMVEGRPF
jgi:hypothetical protein